MDLVRTCYNRPAKFFRDSSRVDSITWYRAPPGAKVFPVPHKMNSLYWYSSPWTATGVGENFDDKATYSNGATPPDVKGTAYCGSLSDFTLGPAFNPSNNTPRDANGIPFACPQIVTFPSACFPACPRSPRIYLTITAVYSGSLFSVGDVIPLNVANGGLEPPYTSQYKYMWTSNLITFLGVRYMLQIVCQTIGAAPYFRFVNADVGNFIYWWNISGFHCHPAVGHDNPAIFLPAPSGIQSFHYELSE